MGKTLSTYTIIRNGIEFQYPFLECARACLGVADQVVFVVGVDENLEDDGTLQALAGLQDEVGDISKLHLVVKFWKPNYNQVFAEFREAGRLACTGNWNIRIGADEVIHERDYPIIKALIRANQKAYRFPQIRFYRDYFTEITSEVDAGGYMYLYNADYVRYKGIKHEFREENLDGLVYPGTNIQFDEGIVIPQVRIFHYWVKDEIEMQVKGKERSYQGPHPAVMGEKIEEWLKKKR